MTTWGSSFVEVVIIASIIPAIGVSALGLTDWRALRRRRNRPDDRLGTGQRHRFAVVHERNRSRAVRQRIRRGMRGDVYANRLLAPANREGQPRQPIGEPRRKREWTALIPHAAKTEDERNPCSSERCHVQAIARVVLEIVEVHERCL